MSDQTSIFNESQPSTTATPGGSTPNPSQQHDELATLLSQVKNENGEPKYKTIKDALVGLAHAQTHIQTLLTEKRTVEEELGTLRPVATKVTELEGLVRRLTESSTTAAPPAQGMSEEAVATLVEQTLTRQQQAQVATANLGKVVEAVKKAHGEKAEEVFYQKAKELGMTQQQVNELAARTPVAVLKLLGLDTTSSTTNQASPASSINTTSLVPNTESAIGRNKVKLGVGATHQEIMAEAREAKRMVEELATKGISIDDLTKPSNYFKHFGQ